MSALPLVTTPAIPAPPARISITITTGLEAIEMYKAADNTVAALGSNVWGAFAVLVEREAEPITALGLAEKEYKAKHAEDSNLPNPYRSAKSVALAAKALGLPLTDANGEALGKSAVQEAIRKSRLATAAAHDAAGAEPVDSAASSEKKDYVGAAVRALLNLKRKAWADCSPEERKQVQDAYDALLA